MYVKIQVMEERGKGQPKTAFKFVDMSSQGESGDSDKQNCSSHISRATPSQLLNQCRPCTNVDNSKLRTVTTHNKATPLKDLQFSTLSLDAPSLDYDQIGPNANGQLIDQNDQLNAANKALKRQLAAAESRNGELERAVTQLEQRCGLYHAQIGQLQRTSEKLQAQCAQMQKQYENKLLNFELPGSKTWVQETGRFYSQLSLKIKTLADKHLRELAKQKMNPVVQQIITAFITELLEMGLKPNSDRSEASNRFKSRGSNAMAYRSHRMAEISRTDRTAEAIGQDYRMLSKSIEKLKNMEKEIEESGGSFLRKKVEEEVSVLNGSVGLGQSVVGGLDRSKSRRKRIFQ